MIIERDLAERLRQAADSWPVVTLTGPRQSGKTTLCQSVFWQHPHVSLEALDTRAFATEDPRGFLGQFPDGAVIDEIQRVPGLLSYLQVLVDADPTPGRWILTGSQNLGLLQSISQSLAGRTAVLRLLPLTRSEVVRFTDHPLSLDETLSAGGYPGIFDRGLDPSEWLSAYVATYIERDVRTISNVGDLVAFQRFVQLCAGRTSQLINYSSLASDCGVTQPTAKAWMSILEACFVVFRLPALHATLRKRLVNMPKLHFYDTGLVCWLLGIRDAAQLAAHPLRGSILETWVASEVVKHRANHGSTGELSHYRDRSGAEVDLVIERPGNVTLIEAKASATPSASLLAGAARVREHLVGGSTRSKPDDIDTNRAANVDDRRASATSSTATAAMSADRGASVDDRRASSAEVIEVLCVYGGDTPQRRTDGLIVPWSQLHQHANRHHIT